jgi:hypothetical protein
MDDDPAFRADTRHVAGQVVFALRAPVREHQAAASKFRELDAQHVNGPKADKRQ